MSVIQLSRSQWQIAAALFLVMFATRLHFSTHLADASVAVLFLAGFYLRQALVCGVMIASAFFIDYLAITYIHHNNFCITSAYIALIPAFALTFLAGRGFANAYRGESWQSLFKLTYFGVLGFLAYEIIASGSFYLFSEYFKDRDFNGLVMHLSRYAPHGLTIFAFYIGLTVITHIAICRYFSLDLQQHTKPSQ